MQRKRLLALGASFVALAGLAVVGATTSGAGALPKCPVEPLAASGAAVSASCPTPPPPTTRPPTTRPVTTTTRPPAPPAPLRSTYAGTLTVGSSRAAVVLDFTGDSGPIYVIALVGDGVNFDCHGGRSLGAVRVTAAGSRSGSAVTFSQSGSTEYSGVSIDVSVTANATLSPDGSGLAGSVHLHVGVPILGDCDYTWGFQAVSMVPDPAPSLVSVPGIVGLPVAQAVSALRSAGLVPGNVRELEQPDCGDGVGSVLGQSPSAGTRVQPGSAVGYTVGVRPKPPRQCL